MLFKKKKTNYQLNADELQYLDAIIDSHLKPLSFKNSCYRMAHVISEKREKEYLSDLEYEVFLLGIKHKIKMQKDGEK